MNKLEKANFKHPKALWYLASGQGVISVGSGFIWSLFVLYLTKDIHLTSKYTYEIFAAGTAMLGVVGIICGYVAQKTGYVKALFTGMILRIIAFCLLAIPNIYCIELSLAFLAVGQGFSYTAYLLVLGRMYAKDDPRRDSGFTASTFIMNIGFLFAGVGGALVLHFSYNTVFLFGGGFLAAGTLIYLAGLKYMKAHHTQTLKPESKKSTSIQWGINILISAILILITYFVLHSVALTNYLIFITSFVMTFIWILLALKGKKKDRNPMIVLLILCGVQIIWNALHFGESSSLIMFLQTNVNRVFFGFKIPASTYSMDINTIYTLILTAFFSYLWMHLAKKKKEPSVPVKTAVGMVAVAVGWGILYLVVLSHPKAVTSVVWVIIAYFPIIISGAILYPIGNAMIGRYTPTKWEGPMMATFQLYTMGTGVMLGAFFAGISSVPKHATLLASNMAFVKAFGWMTFYGAITAIILIILLPFIKKLMMYKDKEKI